MTAEELYLSNELQAALTSKNKKVRAQAERVDRASQDFVQRAATTGQIVRSEKKARTEPKAPGTPVPKTVSTAAGSTSSGTASVRTASRRDSPKPPPPKPVTASGRTPTSAQQEAFDTVLQRSETASAIPHTTRTSQPTARARATSRTDQTRTAAGSASPGTAAVASPKAQHPKFMTIGTKPSGAPPRSASRDAQLLAPPTTVPKATHRDRPPLQAPVVARSSSSTSPKATQQRDEDTHWQGWSQGWWDNSWWNWSENRWFYWDRQCGRWR